MHSSRSSLSFPPSSPPFERGSLIQWKTKSHFQKPQATTTATIHGSPTYSATTTESTFLFPKSTASSTTLPTKL